MMQITTRPSIHYETVSTIADTFYLSVALMLSITPSEFSLPIITISIVCGFYCKRIYVVKYSTTSAHFRLINCLECGAYKEE